ncbi:MAG: CDP-alcohol phosphatidyltransferase family protein [Candidatus Heimdallarchaeota archaeon]|nr:CDP-alcohol phosphatidyltransferase family protein [Candidatus Heimdallarchaeota archaeon]MBY8995491.1 CDP-alcohol phosphatidyltransferase family protein [Candidatus Heimdallarchaeota archaeon]
MSRWRNFKLKTRAAYKKITEPMGKFFGKLNISPNTITMISGLFAIATATMYSFNGRVGSFEFWWLIGFALSILTGFIDVIDGSVARAMGKTTMFGKVLDPVMDRFAEFCFLIGISIGIYSFEPLESFWAPIATIPVAAWCLFSFAGMIFASYARARGESVARVNVESVGIMERREKLIILFIGNLLYYWFNVALILAIILVGILSFITTIQRMVYIRKIMKEIESEEQSVAETEEITKETIN